MIEILIILLASFTVLGFVQSTATQVMSGLANVVLIPWVTALAYLNEYRWLAGFFTFYCITLTMTTIRNANAELARRRLAKAMSR